MARPEAAACLRPAAAVTLMLASAAVSAQDMLQPSVPTTSARPSLWLEPSVSLRQTFTNNARLQPDGRKDAVTELAPRLRIQSFAGRLQGSLDYTLTGLVYARTPDENRLQHSLSAIGRGELVDRWLYMDAGAQVSRVSRNALGASQVDDATASDEQTTTASVQVSPYMKGALASWADYELRLGLNATRTEDSPADSYANSALVRLVSPGSAQRRLGWNLEMSHQSQRFLQGSRSQSDRIVGSLLYGFAPEWRLALRAGREFNDVISAKREGYDSWGLGLRWTPSPRTTVDIEADDRYFGHSHSLRFEHRLARTVFSLTDSRDVNGDAGRGGSGAGLRTVYDLLYDLLASSVPDPLARAAAVDAYLQNNGLTRASLARGGFLTTSVSLQQRQQAAVAYTGVRSTLLLSLQRSQTRALNPAQSVLPGLPAGAGARQHGLSLMLSHRLTPQSALTLQANVERSETLQAGTADTSATTRTLAAAWTLQLPQRSALSLSARRVLNHRSTDAYNESAVSANLTKSF